MQIHIGSLIVGLIVGWLVYQALKPRHRGGRN